MSRSGFVLTADRKVPPGNSVPQFTGAHPIGGPTRVAEEGPPQFWTTGMKDESGSAVDQFRRHARNFIDCVKTRQTPVSDLDSGQHVATLCHLANLSLRLARQLRWDAKNETITGDEEAVAHARARVPFAVGHGAQRVTRAVAPLFVVARFIGPSAHWAR